MINLQELKEIKLQHLKESGFFKDLKNNYKRRTEAEKFKSEIMSKFDSETNSGRRKCKEISKTPAEKHNCVVRVYNQTIGKLHQEINAKRPEFHGDELCLKEIDSILPLMIGLAKQRIAFFG